jgi:hypothetical protein
MAHLVQFACRRTSSSKHRRNPFNTFYRYSYEAPDGRTGTTVASSLASARAKAWHKLNAGLPFQGYGPSLLKLKRGEVVDVFAKSNPRRRRARRNPAAKPFTRFRVYVHDPSYGKPFYGDAIARQTPPYEADREPWGKHGAIKGPAYLIQRSANSGATWYAPSQFRRVKR